jgi:hypothetical protein
MKANRSMISKLSALALGGLLSGAPLAARAEQPTTAAEAQSRADHYRELADKYRLQGGVLYKTGNIQRAEQAASNCETVANQLTPVVAVADTATAVDVATATPPLPPGAPHCPEP